MIGLGVKTRTDKTRRDATRHDVTRQGYHATLYVEVVIADSNELC